MDKDTLRRLELLNQLALTDAEKAEVTAYFSRRVAARAVLDTVPTEDTERMVHVRPILTVVREDVSSQPFTRDELQAGAPDAGEGFWRVPRVLE